MEDLFSQLIPIIVALGFVYWWHKVDSPNATPFKASLFYFFTAIIFIVKMFGDTAETTKIFCGGLASHFIFVAALHLVTNDSETYHREASVWVFGLTGLVMGTGALMLAMDYSNTQALLNPLIIGFVSGSLGSLLNARRTETRKETDPFAIPFLFVLNS